MKWRKFHIRKPDRKILFSENLLYAMVWIAVFLVPILNWALMSEKNFDIANILISWLKIAPYFIVFAIHNTFIARQLLLRRKYLAYTLTTLALLGVVFAGADIYQKYIEGKFFVRELSEFIPRHSASITDLQWYYNLLLGLFMLGLHDGIIMIFKSIADEQRMEALKRQNVQTEMDYLKYQINPHFFMNTLNNIHALIDIDTETAKDCVIELSKMMRYVLYESGASEISLANELKFISNYINLMKIRYAGDIDITFRQPQRGMQNIAIPPLLLIVFVENAFKHGISYKSPSFIHINVECDGQSVIFAIENSRHKQSSATERKVGIGLENVGKRLDLLYGSDYTLDIDESEADVYRVKLVIPVSKR